MFRRYKTEEDANTAQSRSSGHAEDQAALVGRSQGCSLTGGGWHSERWLDEHQPRRTFLQSSARVHVAWHGLRAFFSLLVAASDSPVQQVY